MADHLAHETEYRGKQEIKRLAQSRVLVCGAGAVGSNLIVNLCRQGFQAIAVCDFDRVESHNVGTQAYGRKDVGAKKVAALRDLVFRDTGISINIFDKKLDQENHDKWLKSAGIIVDAFDNSASRQLTYDGAKKHAIPCLHVGLDAGYGEVCWNSKYNVPGDRPDGEDGPCDYPLARNLVAMAVAVASESLVEFILTGKENSYDITLRDRQVRPR